MDAFHKAMMITKLKDIVQARRIDVDRLSEKATVPVDRLTQILAGADPSLRELRLIASALNLSISDVALPDHPKKSLGLLFRAAGINASSASSTVMGLLLNKIDYSFELLNIARGTKPWWTDHFKSSTQTYLDAEENARIFREVLFNDDQASPLLALPSIVLDKMGILLFLTNMPGVDGASVYIERIPFIFVSRRYEGRMLFTLAHELAHIIAPQRMGNDFVVLDEASETESTDDSSGKQEEQYAHAFASCLLMPGPGVGIALKKIRQIYEIKEEQLGDIEVLLLSRIFGVSFVAAARRCEDLRLLPRGGGQSLNDWLRKEYGSAEKRAASVGLPARPRIDFPRIPKQLLVAAIQRVKDGDISIGRASSILGLSISDLLSLNEPLIN
jgi:Zn-dependent peptidase ImmA (M78 family)